MLKLIKHVIYILMPLFIKIIFLDNDFYYKNFNVLTYN